MARSGLTNSRLGSAEVKAGTAEDQRILGMAMPSNVTRRQRKTTDIVTRIDSQQTESGHSSFFLYSIWCRVEHGRRRPVTHMLGYWVSHMRRRASPSFPRQPSGAVEIRYRESRYMTRLLEARVAMVAGELGELASR